MNYFLYGHKNQIRTFCIIADGFEIFVASVLFRKILFKVLLASMKTLTNSRDFTGGRPPYTPTRLAATQKGIVILNSSFEKAA
jgi:hypothetical protein